MTRNDSFWLMQRPDPPRNTVRAPLTRRAAPHMGTVPFRPSTRTDQASLAPLDMVAMVIHDCSQARRAYICK